MTIQCPQRTPIPRFPVVSMVPRSPPKPVLPLLEYHMVHHAIHKNASHIGLIRVKVPGDKAPALSHKQWTPPHGCLTVSSSYLPIDQVLDSRGIFHFYWRLERARRGLSPSIVRAHNLITSPVHLWPQLQRYTVYSWPLVSLASHFRHCSDGLHTSH